MRNCIVLLFMLVPVLAKAQYWRVQASGGIATASVIGRHDDVVIGPQNPAGTSANYRTSHMPNDNMAFSSWGLAFFRKTGNLELGLQIESMAIRSKHSGSFSYSGSQLVEAYKLTSYLGRPVVPFTAICNYYAGSSRGNAYVGLSAGTAYAAGKRQADFSEIPVSNDMRLYYNSAWGLAAGLHAGYRKEIGPADFGFQLQCKYMNFQLTHGSSDQHYTTALLVPAAQLYAGYRFGQRKPAVPAAAPAALQ